LETSLIRAEVDLIAIAQNVTELRRITNPQAKVMAVVKADAYGHGAEKVAETALKSGAEVLGVARLNEAVALREAGFTVPIQIFGYTPPSLAEILIQYELTQTVFSYQNASALSETAISKGEKIKIHIKVDTGMGRLGLVTDCGTISCSEINLTESSLQQIISIMRLKGLIPEGIMTHFASADITDKSYAGTQFSIFMNFISQLKKKGIEFSIRHAANSAAIMEMPETHLDLVRPGISIYGLYASNEVNRNIIRLKPAMSIKTKVVHVKRIPEGFFISYAQTYHTQKPTTVATVSIGYADGFNRLLSSCGSMLVHGQRAPVIGRVCMDLTMLDVSHIPHVDVGDEVVVFGAQKDEFIHVDEIAQMLNTINYEIISTITSRVPRIYKE
jgi:alanine racemase